MARQPCGPWLLHTHVEGMREYGWPSRRRARKGHHALIPTTCVQRSRGPRRRGPRRPSCCLRSAAGAHPPPRVCVPCSPTRAAARGCNQACDAARLDSEQVRLYASGPTALRCSGAARLAAVHPRTIKSRALPTTPGQPPRHSTAATGSEMPGARGLQKQLCAAEQPTPWPDLVAGAAASCGAACVLPASRLLRRVLVMMTAYSAARPFVCCPRQLLWRACFVPCSCCCCCGCWLATAGRGAACTPAMSRRPLCQLQVVVATCRAAVQGCCPRPRRCQRQLDAAAAAKPSSALCH